ncbi:MAG: hypothetical protein JWQ84_3363 [Mucilaginibacter sp.]|jgi:hypothetical protein|nr:hypothetical protein [Mucilaginibacter sp.]MDB5018531.1 hypothetical protein [Mucilaginibacter sp.]MDB5140409.1 hypothetical protein [Mucilaginibacter sp.]
MEKGLILSAETLASLDLLIADKKQNKAFTVEFYWVINLIFGGPPIKAKTVTNTNTQFKLIEKVINSTISILKEASVAELIEIREHAHVAIN